MAIEKISKILGQQSKLKRLHKPLQAAYICEVAQALSHGHYRPISFKNGLLTVGVSSSAAAANLQMENTQIIAQINQKIGKDMVKKIRFKIE